MKHKSGALKGILVCRQHKRDIRRALLQTPAKDARWGPLASAEQLLIAYNKSRQQETLQSVRVVLQDRGFWLGSYIPDDTVLGIGDGAAAEAVRQLDGVIWVVSFPLSGLLRWLSHRLHGYESRWPPRCQEAPLHSQCVW